MGFDCNFNFLFVEQIMARVLVQSTNIPGMFAGIRSGGSRSAKMTFCVRSPGVRLNAFSGLRSFNAVDSMAMSGRSRVSLTVSSGRRRQKLRRFGARAMFERFTEKAIKVIMLAQEEARRLGHNFVGTEQILLGLIGEGTGIAAKVLKSMGINLKDARVEVEKIIGRGSGFVAVEIPFTPRAKRVLELSLEEARQLGKDGPLLIELN